MPAQRCLSAVLELRAGLGGSESGDHNCWSPGSRALRMLISMHKTLILPKLTWQCLPKAHVSAGKWMHRLADHQPAAEPGVTGTHLMRGLVSVPVPGRGERARLLLALPLPSAAGSLSLPAAPERCSRAETLEIVVVVMPSCEVGHAGALFISCPSLAKVLFSYSGGMAKERRLAAAAGRSGHQRAAAPSGTCLYDG